MSPTSAVWVRDPEVLWRNTAHGVVLLPAGAEEPFALTDSGAALWTLVETPVRLDEVATRLAANYGTSPAVVAESIRPLLADLERRHAVRRVP